MSCMFNNAIVVESTCRTSIVDLDLYAKFEIKHY